MQETQVQSLDREDPLGRKWQPTPVFLPGKSHGERNLVGYSPWGRKRVGHNLATNQQDQRKCYPEVANVKRVGWRMTLLQQNLKRMFFIIFKKLT